VDLDDITVEHLCYSSGILPCILSKLFNMCMTVDYVPLSFGKSYTVPILKDKNAIHCKSLTVDDSRGISISPVISKIFEHCILNRYRDYFKTSDNQFGFKQGSICAHALYYVNCGSTINICALDLSKASDNMSHHGLFRLDALALSAIATATWLGGWLAVTLRYCIKTAKPI